MEIIVWMHHPQIGSNEDIFHFILHMFIIVCGHPLKSCVSLCCLSRSLSTSGPQLTHTIHLFVIFSSLTLSLLLSSHLSLLIIHCNLMASPSHPHSPVLPVFVCVSERIKKREKAVCNISRVFNELLHSWLLSIG